MSGSGRLRVVLVAGAAVLAMAVYLLPKTPKPETAPPAETAAASEESAFSIEKFIADSKVKLGWDADNKVSRWEADLGTEGSAHPELFDSIAASWENAEMPGIAAWYFNRKANNTGTEKDWLGAAYRYFDAYKSASDSLSSAFFLNKAITCYSKVLELNPGNLNAKTDLGLLYAEGTPEPMKGIMLLREVVTEDPNHENANLNLGFLSMRSGQYEKAVERFKKVLEIDPARVDMYVYIGESYARMNNINKAIENFEIFKNLSNDQKLIAEVNAYIARLKSGATE